MVSSMLQHTSALITLNLITDDASKPVAQEAILAAVNSTGKDIKVIYYDIKEVTAKMGGLVDSMRVHFTSQPGGYYSDSLFFVSLILHHVAPLHQTQVVMLDVDTKLLEDIVLLFREFDRFNETNLVGCSVELTPVYQHVLYRWRSKHAGSRLGSPASRGGFPGINSGVLLLRLDRIRMSALYDTLLQRSTLQYLTSKYFFKGHLGDQDFYTLVALEHPELFYMLDCGWNRQLCTWWRDHGYQDSFSSFAECQSPVKIYHGNCNTPIPSS
ncbi:hypothetical protein AAG570_005121 [Ranatra chinensis]|uniref:Xyloside xylosyltransferase 1 n=1 Tax=Ranatra chinensis TaxID=642074 RepID=A0ABD0XZH9_9HEMI